MKILMDKEIETVGYKDENFTKYIHFTCEFICENIYSEEDHKKGYRPKDKSLLECPVWLFHDHMRLLSLILQKSMVFYVHEHMNIESYETDKDGNTYPLGSYYPDHIEYIKYDPNFPKTIPDTIIHHDNQDELNNEKSTIDTTNTYFFKWEHNKHYQVYICKPNKTKPSVSYTQSKRKKSRKKKAQQPKKKSMKDTPYFVEIEELMKVQKEFASYRETLKE